MVGTRKLVATVPALQHSFHALSEASRLSVEKQGAAAKCYGRDTSMFNILSANLALSTIVFWIACRIYVMPRLSRLTYRDVLIPIFLLHMLRHLGLMFLAAGATYEGLPAAFAYPAAIGDCVAAALAAAALYLVIHRARAARGVTWLFAIWGCLDLLVAIGLATYYDAQRFMGAAYWIPAFWVPTLLVTHYLTFVVLRRHWREQ